jgi:hypothetical protein
MRLFLLRGRSERRVPVGVAVYLARASLPSETELAVATDVGQHGLRVTTKRYWRPGEYVIVSPLSNEPRITAKVAYCWRRLEHTCTTGLQVESDQPRWWEKLLAGHSSTRKLVVPSAESGQDF